MVTKAGVHGTPRDFWLIPTSVFGFLPYDAIQVFLPSVAISYLMTLRQSYFWPLGISWSLSNPFPWMFLCGQAQKLPAEVRALVTSVKEQGGEV